MALPQQRHARILEILEAEGAVRTSDLAESFQVTDETIRRDLEYLHRERLLIRTHGGAIALGHPGRDLSLREREVRNLSLKERIAREATRLLRPGDVVFIDASSTALQLARNLSEMELTVVTNAHRVIGDLSGNSTVRLIGTGGLFDPNSQSYVGPIVEYTARRFHFNWFFFSGNGIDLERGVSESNEAQANFKAEVRCLSERSVLLADSTKIGHRSSYFFCPLDAIDLWILDDGADTDGLIKFHEKIRSIKIV